MHKNTRLIVIGRIRAAQDMQTRYRLNDKTVREYAEALGRGETFPPLMLFQDGDKFLLADGFHRLAAYKQIGRPNDAEVECTVETGDKWSAIRSGIQANDTHGLRRTNADKRRTVELLLSAPGADGASDHVIAAQALVSHTLVAKVRKAQLATAASSSGGLTKRVGQDGKSRKVQQKKPGPPAAPVNVPAPSISGCPAPCINCASTERDVEGECAQCHEPNPDEPLTKPVKETNRPVAGSKLIELLDAVIASVVTAKDKLAASEGLLDSDAADVRNHWSDAVESLGRAHDDVERVRDCVS